MKSLNIKKCHKVKTRSFRERTHKINMISFSKPDVISTERLHRAQDISKVPLEQTIYDPEYRIWRFKR